jgi:hypothetical protein
MEIAQAVVATVAEGELERVGHLTTELEILAGMARGGGRIAAGVAHRRPAGMLSGHGFLSGFLLEMVERIGKRIATTAGARRGRGRGKTGGQWPTVSPRGDEAAEGNEPK